jgi:hypothetical protein
MISSRRSWNIARGLAVIATAALAVSCGRAGQPLGPTGVNDPVADDAFDARPAKTSLCHFDEATGTYFALELTEQAAEAHRRHGDGAVGDPVPGQPDMVFGDDCVPELAVVPYTLTCGAPPNPINPGSTTPPGPTLDTTRGGQFIQYMVSVAPVPPAGSEVLWSMYLDGVLIPPQVLRPLDVNGTYTQFGHGVGMSTSSGVFEIRFEFDGSACSLYWNLNP